MYEALLAVHSWLRWIVLLVGVYAFARAAAGRFSRRPWAPADEAASRWFVIAVDLQVVIGLLLGASAVQVSASLGASVSYRDERDYTVKMIECEA